MSKKYENTIQALDVNDELKKSIQDEIDGIEGKVLFLSNEINQILEHVFIQAYTNQYIQKIFDVRNQITLWKFNSSNLINALESIKKVSWYKYNDQLKNLIPVWGERSVMIDAKLRHFDLIISFLKDYNRYINEQMNLLDNITYNVKK